MNVNAFLILSSDFSSNDPIFSFPLMLRPNNTTWNVNYRKQFIWFRIKLVFRIGLGSQYTYSDYLHHLGMKLHVLWIRRNLMPVFEGISNNEAMNSFDNRYFRSVWFGWHFENISEGRLKPCHQDMFEICMSLSLTTSMHTQTCHYQVFHIPKIQLETPNKV